MLVGKVKEKRANKEGAVGGSVTVREEPLWSIERFGSNFELANSVSDSHLDKLPQITSTIRLDPLAIHSTYRHSLTSFLLDRRLNTNFSSSVAASLFTRSIPHNVQLP